MKNFIELKIIHISKKCEQLKDLNTKRFLTQKVKVLKSNFIDKNFYTCENMIKTIYFQLH